MYKTLRKYFKRGDYSPLTTPLRHAFRRRVVSDERTGVTKLPRLPIDRELLIIVFRCRVSWILVTKSKPKTDRVNSKTALDTLVALHPKIDHVYFPGTARLNTSRQ